MTEKLSNPNRRSMLAGMGVVAAVGGLVACGSSGDSASGGSGDSASGGSGGSGSGSSGSGGSAGAGSTGGSGVLIPKSKVAVGAGYLDTDQKIVVSQPTAGNYKAFSSVCTHAGCPMTKLSGTTISCACHGSKFKITDGSVEQGPATEPLPAKKVTAEGENLQIT